MHLVRASFVSTENLKPDEKEMLCRILVWIGSTPYRSQFVDTGAILIFLIFMKSEEAIHLPFRMGNIQCADGQSVITSWF